MNTEPTYDITEVEVEDCEIFWAKTLQAGLSKEEMLKSVAELKTRNINFQVYEASQGKLHQLVISHINLI